VTVAAEREKLAIKEGSTGTDRRFIGLDGVVLYPWVS
jgi:hypothetical protein